MSCFTNQPRVGNIPNHGSGSGGSTMCDGEDSKTLSKQPRTLVLHIRHFWLFLFFLKLWTKEKLAIFKISRRQHFFCGNVTEIRTAASTNLQVNLWNHGSATATFYYIPNPLTIVILWQNYTNCYTFQKKLVNLLKCSAALQLIWFDFLLISLVHNIVE